MSTRPRYETEAHLQAERAFAADLQTAWNCELIKLAGANERTYRLDYSVVRGGVLMALLEIKVRNNPSDQYETLMLSLSKWATGVRYYQAGLDFAIAVRWEDKDGHYKYNPLDMGLMRFEHSGRTVQTRDAGDIEPVVMIPVSLFTLTERLNHAGTTKTPA